MRRRRTALVLSVLLLLLAAVPAGAVERRMPANLDALVYYQGELTEQALVERMGITPRVYYEQFALVQVTPAQLQRLELSGAQVEVLSDRRRVEIGRDFDSGKNDGLLPGERRRVPKGTATYLVQFMGPIKLQWLDRLRDIGVQLYGAVAHYTLIVHMDPAQRRKVEAMPTVEWVGYYQPAYKLSADLRSGETAVVEFFPGTAMGSPGLERAGLEVRSLQVGQALVEGETQEGQALVEGKPQEGRALVRGSLHALERAAGMEHVAWIEPLHEPSLLNAVSREVITADVAHSQNIIGRNQIVAVTDTGVYKDHEAFCEEGKVVAVVDMVGDSGGAGGDGHGHGTHVAGSVLSDAPDFGAYTGNDGQGFGARLVDVKVFTNSGSWAGGSDYYAFWNLAYSHGARVNSNSFGSSSGGAYGSTDRDADRITFDRKDYTLTIAAGNAGSEARTVGSPASAKNAITVGATMTASPQDMAGFSSRGPTRDDRIKPDVVAPGSHIRSALRGSVTDYTVMQGTSMATPQVAGAAAVVRQYFADGFYPSGSANPGDVRVASGALVKAVLINGAEEITGTGSDSLGEGKYPNSSQGWGQVNLDRSLYFVGDDRSLMLWDIAQTPATGSAWRTSFAVFDGSEAVKVTLVWTDPAAVAGAGVALVNNLNLRVTAPDGSIFLGNTFSGRNPGYSTGGGSFDARNPVEGIHLVPMGSFTGQLPTGTYEVEVIGANVPTGGSNFALAISAGAGNSQPAPRPEAGVAVMGDYNHQLSDLLTARGFSVTAYGGNDYSQMISNLSQYRTVVLHRVANSAGFESLLRAAADRGTGLLFASSYSVYDHAPGILAARGADLSRIAQYWNHGNVRVRVAAAHPVFRGYGVGSTITIISGGDNDYQNFDGYSGSIIGTSETMNGHSGMIGVRNEVETGGSRHVVMGSFGASSWTGTAHWTADGKEIFVNAVEWAGRMDQP